MADGDNPTMKTELRDGRALPQPRCQLRLAHLLDLCLQSKFVSRKESGTQNTPDHRSKRHAWLSGTRAETE